MASVQTSTATATQIPHILIADSESLMCELLEIRFEDEGFRTTVVKNAADAMKQDLPTFSLALIDLMDQTFNGLRLIECIKSKPETVGLPIIMMTSKASEDTIVEALDLGADDFISKPFSTRELIARVRSVIRRRRMTNARRVANVLRFNDLTLDMAAGTAFLDGMELSLSHTEFKLLALFLRNRNHFYDRAQIRAEVWDNDSDISDRAVDTGISRLRKKLCDYGRNLVNRKGFGYGFVE